MDATEPDVCLLIVEDSFLISGRGRVLAPGLSTITKLIVKPGDTVNLIRPDGSFSETVIKSVDAVHLRRSESPSMVFMITLPKSITADDLPKGTKVVMSNKVRQQPA